MIKVRDEIMTAKYESFVEAVKTIKSLAVVDNDDQLLVIVRGFDDPFFIIRKVDQAISSVIVTSNACVRIACFNSRMALPKTSLSGSCKPINLR